LQPDDDLGPGVLQHIDLVADLVLQTIIAWMGDHAGIRICLVEVVEGGILKFREVLVRNLVVPILRVDRFFELEAIVTLLLQSSL